ncbi:MAG TPA: pirin family protein [Chitinophagaceae bacterium]|nr:pirin family protein [Chitinophagaceae bacterium]
MSTKTIQRILKGRPINVGSIRVQELLPTQDGYMDPFLVFHHGIAPYEKNIPVKHQGVGPHPHRGFSAISFIYRGGIHHRDSRGNDHVVYAGGTQWIHAGRGIIHSERPPEDIHDLGGEAELLQVWVNSPAVNKMDQPHYYPATAEDTPTIVSEDGLTIVRVPAGEFMGKKGIIPTFTKVNTLMSEMKTDGAFTFPIPQHHNTLLYVLSGSVRVNGEQTVLAKEMVQFNQDGDAFTVEAITDTMLFVGSGEPLNEPIVAHGPFVMNTETEIMEAFRDYQMGKMGVLIEN